MNATVKKTTIILLVEDDADLRAIFRIALMLAGYDVREAGDGYDALVMLEQGGADLMVLDLRMPRLDGLSVLAEMQAHALALPVVVVTASPIEPAGFDVDCVLRKPVHPDTLVATVQKCLEARQIR